MNSANENTKRFHTTSQHHNNNKMQAADDDHCNAPPRQSLRTQPRQKNKRTGVLMETCNRTRGMAAASSSSSPCRVRRVTLYSTEKARLVEFNLHLDINNLKQEIHQLAHHRELILSKDFVARHARENSRMRVVHEFYRMFYRWWQSREVADSLGANTTITRVRHKRTRDASLDFVSDDQQQQFLSSIMHQQVDCGPNIVGVSQLWTQLMYYETLMRARVQNWHNSEIVECEHDFLVRTEGQILATITRETIQLVFPHVLAYEELMSQLVGQRLEFACTWEFLFDEDGKIKRYGLSIDFAHGFARILKDPHQVAILLGQALIGENSMLQLDSGQGEEEETTSSGEEEGRKSDVDHILHGMDGRLITTSEEVSDDNLNDDDDDRQDDEDKDLVEVEAELHEMELDLHFVTDQEQQQEDQVDGSKRLQSDVMQVDLALETDVLGDRIVINNHDDADPADPVDSVKNTSSVTSSVVVQQDAPAQEPCVEDLQQDQDQNEPVLNLQQVGDRVSQHRMDCCQARVAQYYAQFAHGLDLMAVDTQQSFLGDFLHPRVAIVAGTHDTFDRCRQLSRDDPRMGVSLVLEKWKRLSWFFECFSYQLVHSEAKPLGNGKIVVRSVGKYTLRVLQRSIDHVFVNLRQFPQLVQQITGQELVCWSNLEITFDAKQKPNPSQNQSDQALEHEETLKALRFEEKMHFMRAFNDLLRDPRATACILKHALLQSDGWCGANG